MKKIFLTITIILFTINFLNAQDTAILKVIVLNEFNNPIVGEQILFKSKDGTFNTKNVTDKDGVFRVKLIGGKTYNIKVKTIGEAKEYNTIEIPALEEGYLYSENLLTITIFESKSFTLDNVYFDSGKSTLKQESYKELNELFEYLNLKNDIIIEVSGHTDSIGNDDANMILSENRAKRVKTYLLSKGISENRIFIQAYGETRPIASNDNANGRSLNRRIEVKVLE